MIDPGTLKHRLTLEIPVETPDGAGGVARAYEAGPRLWASMTPVSAREQVIAAANGATVTHRIITRAGPEITTRHRLRKGARVFSITAVREHDTAGAFLLIAAEERRA